LRRGERHKRKRKGKKKNSPTKIHWNYIVTKHSSKWKPPLRKVTITIEARRKPHASPLCGDLPLCHTHHFLPSLYNLIFNSIMIFQFNPEFDLKWANHVNSSWYCPWSRSWFQWVNLNGLKINYNFFFKCHLIFLFKKSTYFLLVIWIIFGLVKLIISRHDNAHTFNSKFNLCNELDYKVLKLTRYAKFNNTIKKKFHMTWTSWIHARNWVQATELFHTNNYMRYIIITISKWCDGITVPPHLNHCGLQQ
jgi:hypothetical protein